MVEAEISNYWLTRLVFQRGLALIYLIGFLIILNQYVALVGEKGLLPVGDFLKRSSFSESPSIFWFKPSDTVFMTAAYFGLILSFLALTGISEKHGLWFSVFVWASLWLLYLSFVNFGQTFYGFGWEILLLEAGFLTIFLGSADRSPPVIIIWLLRWLLFRVMFGAGLIKIRGDSCWRDLTCMFYHYETQPVPNPLSYFFHRLPHWFHRLEVAFTHFVELIIPFGYFIPRFVAYAGGITIFFQFVLILSGNLAWLNYITIVLCIPCFDDQILSKIIPIETPKTTPIGWGQKFSVGILTLTVAYLSIKPIKNLFSSRQSMNRSFDNLHLVNTYGAFGSVTRERYEIVIEGTNETEITDQTKWIEYEFKAKPGKPALLPQLMSPYLYKLDWQIWFAAMNSHHYHPWFSNLILKLLENDPATLKLLRTNPFPSEAPKFVRALHYKYRFVNDQERKNEKTWWKRELVGEYFPTVGLKP